MEPAVTVVEREKARYAPPPVRDSERSEAGQRRAGEGILSNWRKLASEVSAA